MHRGLITLLTLTLLTAGCADDSAESDGPDPTTTPSTASSSVPPPTSTPTTTSTPEFAMTTTQPPAVALTVGAEAGDANFEELQAFLADRTDDGPFYMVNLLRYRDEAEYADDRETDLTGEEADAIYSNWMKDIKLPEIGAEIMYSADVEQDLVGGTSFDRVAIVRYPSRAEFAEMVADPEFQAMNVHKRAGVADTVVMATRLIEVPPVPPLDDPPFPATADDPPFAFVHVLDYRDTAVYQPGDADADDTRTGRDAVALYSNNAGLVAVPLGVRPVAWFEVITTVIGPLDTWEEVRINMFPSHATFDALTSDPTWASGTHHRTAGLEATYAIQTLPVINAFE